MSNRKVVCRSQRVKHVHPAKTRADGKDFDDFFMSDGDVRKLEMHGSDSAEALSKKGTKATLEFGEATGRVFGKWPTASEYFCYSFTMNAPVNRTKSTPAFLVEDALIECDALPLTFRRLKAMLTAHMHPESLERAAYSAGLGSVNFAKATGTGTGKGKSKKSAGPTKDMMPYFGQRTRATLQTFTRLFALLEPRGREDALLSFEEFRTHSAVVAAEPGMENLYKRLTETRDGVMYFCNDYIAILRRCYSPAVANYLHTLAPETLKKLVALLKEAPHMLCFHATKGVFDVPEMNYARYIQLVSRERREPTIEAAVNIYHRFVRPSMYGNLGAECESPDGTGHAYMPADAPCLQMSSPDAGITAAAIEWLLTVGALVRKPETTHLYLDAAWRCHQRLIGHVKDVVERNESVYSHARVDLTNPKTLLDAEQSKVVHHALTRPLTMISGRAGTGKTAVLADICHSWERESVIVATLASRAALNLAQRGIRARTVHSWLALLKKTEVEGSDEFRPEDVRVVAIDEASMIGTRLLCSLLDKLTHRGACLARLIFVGDNGQLPPIEYGRPFADAIEAFPAATFFLTRNYRAESATMFANADLIAAGEPDAVAWDSSFWLVPRPGDDSGFSEKGLEAAMKALVAELPANATAQNTQFIAFTHQEVNAVNGWARRHFNAKAVKGDFSVGDKVSFTGNAYAHDIYHGEILEILDILDEVGAPVTLGPILGINTPRIVMPVRGHLAPHGRTVVFGRGNGTKLVLKTSRVPMTSKTLQFAFCCTIHGFQGSEIDYVVYYMAWASRNANRLHAYTASTRARKCFLVAAAGEDFEAVVKRAGEFRRSDLAEDLGANVILPTEPSHSGLKRSRGPSTFMPAAKTKTKKALRPENTELAEQVSDSHTDTETSEE